MVMDKKSPLAPLFQRGEVYELPPLKKEGWGGFVSDVRRPFLTYGRTLKPIARLLRREMTDAEQRLWFRLRRKQLEGVQFYRQKPIGPYIVDFFAPTIDLVIEVDGSQHFE